MNLEKEIQKCLHEIDDKNPDLIVERLKTVNNSFYFVVSRCGILRLGTFEIKLEEDKVRFRKTKTVDVQFQNFENLEHLDFSSISNIDYRSMLVEIEKIIQICTLEEDLSSLDSISSRIVSTLEILNQNSIKFQNP